MLIWDKLIVLISIILYKNAIKERLNLDRDYIWYRQAYRHKVLHRSLNRIFINTSISNIDPFALLNFATCIPKHFLRFSILCSFFLNQLIGSLSDTVDKVFDSQIENKGTYAEWYNNP